MNATPPIVTDVSTASISDALDSLGMPGSLHGIGSLRPGQRTAGPAFTVSYEPVDEHGGTVGDFLDDVPPGSVIVIDNAGRTDCNVWGGIMSQAAHARGVAGTVINGTCRDVAVANSAGYPIWSAARFMRTGKDRVRAADVQRAVTIDGVTWLRMRPAGAPSEVYYVRVAWAAYPYEAPSVKFAESIGGLLTVASAWPVIPGYRPASLDICKPMTAEGYALHAEWRTGPEAWPTTGNPFLWVAEMLQYDLDNHYGGRSS